MDEIGKTQTLGSHPMTIDAGSGSYELLNVHQAHSSVSLLPHATRQEAFVATPNTAAEYDSYEEDEEPMNRSRRNQMTSSIDSEHLKNGGSAEGEQKKATWKIHWRAPVLIVGYLALGVGFALGHHFYWMSLDGTVVDSETDQEWAKRYGIAFAFLAQSTMTLSVGVAYTQRVWVTVKKNSMTLRSLDRVFSLQDDIFAFFSREIVKKAKVLSLLGICAWCLPISSTFSSATLSVKPGLVSNTTRTNVPIIDYSNDSITFWAIFEEVGTLGLDGATPAITRLASATSASMYILPFSAPFPNSSYTLEFYGPAFKCENLSTAVLDNNLDTGSAKSLQEAWDITMDGKLNTTRETLYVAESPENIEGVAMPSHLFVNTKGSTLFGVDGGNYSCHLWNTSYTVDFAFNDSVQTTNIRQLQHVAPLSISSEGILDTYAPGEIQYWTIFTALTEILVARVGWSSTLSFAGGDSALVRTGLAACPEIRYGDSGMSAYFAALFADWMCRAGSIPAAIEDLSHNLTLSVLSSALLARETPADVRVRRAANFYAYNWRGLVLAYALAVAAAAAAAAVGLHALLANGYSAGASFSSILLATRNAELDAITRGHCLGESPLTSDIKGTVLRFGVLRQEDCDGSAKSHAAFGLRDGVRPIRKGEPCW